MLVQLYLGAGSIIIITITPLQQYDTVTQNEHAIIQTSKAKQSCITFYVYRKYFSKKEHQRYISQNKGEKKELLCHLTRCAYHLNEKLIHDVFILNAAAYFLNRN